MKNEYSLEGKWDDKWDRGSIEFTTNNKEMYDMVQNFVEICAQSMTYRNQMTRIRYLDEKEGQQ